MTTINDDWSPDRERAAQIIYEAFPFDGGAAEKPPWIPGGNSIMQDRARRTVDAIATRAPMDREQVAKIFAYIWHGDLGEWRGFLSKADAFLTYPVPSTHQPAEAKRCSHPDAEVWFYRDDDVYMRCPDCGSRWLSVSSTVPSTDGKSPQSFCGESDCTFQDGWCKCGMEG